jgi:hypothetical protein
MTTQSVADIAVMADSLRQAGFSGVEVADGVIYARLWSSSVEFTAQREGARWVLALQWPVRATDAQMAGWKARYPYAPLDIHKGETRMQMAVAQGDTPALHRWAVGAEDMVARCIEWRRAQRAPGEGM